MSWLDILWLVPALPFFGAALNGVLGPRVPRPLTTAVALGAPGLSLLLALGCLWQYAAVWPRPFEQVLYPWTAGPLAIDIGFLFDPLSAVMAFIVTFVGFWIHVYSVGYMGHDAGYQRYFVYLNLFMGMMLLLVLGNNFLVTFVGWEGVGLCSYLLIGYYYDQQVPPQAGRKAFIVNRIGDFAFLLGLFALVDVFGTLDYQVLLDAIGHDAQLALTPYALDMSLAAFVALCLFVGATGKSAQIPLYVWLPDAMAGPTPVSALIHAATMVTAGVYIVVRTNLLFQLAPWVLAVVAVIGVATAIFAATIALVQTDIKRVLAYSTVSQLGYMFLAAGCGAFSVAIFHLGTHAFFKALLFLGSGSVIHAMGGEQDMRAMGGLKRHLPWTYWTFVVGTLAISGIPIFAGFFSKDAILGAAFAAHPALWAVGTLTALLTAFYMFRLLLLTFHGEFRGSEEQRRHLHESPPSMTLPLVILAIGSTVAGFVGTIPFLHLDWLSDWLAPVIAHVEGAPAHAEHGIELELFLVGLAVLVAVFGWLLARRVYGHGRGLERAEALADRWPAAHRLLRNKYWVDELYDRLVVRPLAALARFCWKVIDTILIDGSVHVGAFLVELTGDLGRFSTTGNVRNYALYFFVAMVLMFCWLVF
ncbi:MAG TPA: NADH-quinone oxidoreductase subunit L [Thermoanaerobaculia bacterium]|nr:NADH-quinone oxidoreductase subunit L [Thermoanaerobaculia bacterium]